MQDDFSPSQLAGFNLQDEEEKSSLELWNNIMIDAMSERASDIHIEPFRNEAVIRLRVDGVLKSVSTHPLTVHNALLKIIKKMGDLNPDLERPQSGKILIKTDRVGDKNQIFDFRIATFPTVFGEKFVARLLDPQNVTNTLKDGFKSVDMSPEEQEKLENIISKPYGLVVFSGPTGSGKTTTVYASLTYLSQKFQGHCGIYTLEEPVEYILEGVNQTQVDADGELNYTRALRSLMRMDPDVIFVGDISSALDTLDMALQVALTGHLVITQYHSSDVAGMIYGLLSHKIEPYLLSMALEGGVCQRLVRKICPHCKTEVPVKKEVLDRIQKNLTEPIALPHTYRGAGCPQCRGTGYRGRTAVYEIVPRSTALMDLISENPGLNRLREKFAEMKIPGIRDSAIKKVREGITTLEEALRIAWYI